MELSRGLPTIGALKLLGDGSYSIYLFHTFVFYAVFYAANSPLARLPAPIPVVAVSVTVTGTAVGIAAFYVIERPLTGLLRRLTRRVAVAPRMDKAPTSRRYW